MACGDDSGGEHAAGPGTDASFPAAAGMDGSILNMESGSGGSGGAGGSAGSPDLNFTPCAFGGTCMCVQCGVEGMCRDCGGGCDCSTINGMIPGTGVPTAMPLPWRPPFDAVGDDGWRESTMPLCAQLQGVISADVWSDDRGVFMLTSGIGFPPQLNDIGSGSDEDAGVPLGGSSVFGQDPNTVQIPRTQLWFNDGSGWTVKVDRSFQLGSMGLAGAIDGPQFLYSKPLSPELALEVMNLGAVPNQRCTLGVVHGKQVDCEDLGTIDALHVVGPTLTYAVVGGTRLLDYDGTRWHAKPSLIPYPATAVWSDGTKTLVVGQVGTAFWQEQDGWKLQDAGIVDHFSQLWGPAADDIWAGTARGEILHYDGEAWTSMGQLGGVTCDVKLPITGIWGSGDDVYFHTDTELAHWDGTKLETLANWSCTGGTSSGVRIQGLWGNSSTEIFLTISDGLRFEAGNCGPEYVVFYDGTEFHRM